MIKKKSSVRQAIYEALDEEMLRDQNVFILGEEVGEYNGAYKVTLDLHLKHNVGERKRVIDTPISEHGFTGVAVGSAFLGLRPVVEFMTFNFSMQAIDQIINSAAKTHYMSGGKVSCPIVFRGPNGPAKGVAAQHSQCYSSWYSHIPGLKVIAPYFASDHKGLLKSAIRDNNPVIFLENEVLYSEIHDVEDLFYEKNFLVEIGKAKIVKSGQDITIVSFSRAVGLALSASEELEKAGINTEVVDLRTIRPMDSETIINSVKKTNRLLVVEECWQTCGVASEVSATISSECFDFLDAPIARLSLEDTPMPYSSTLENAASITKEKIIEAAKKVCQSSI